ncbi:MAG: Ig-like domain-containing protein, partial [Gemmatimonadetes bacterium]|nr:Ig-like domain-containing protein [Gemmatimonadota bacterium]
MGSTWSFSLAPARGGRVLPVLLAVLAFIRCGNPSGSGPAVPAPTCQLRSVQVLPGSATVEVGQGVDLSAPIQQGGCNQVPFSRTWQTSNAAIATVDTNGRVTGVSAGGPVTIQVTVIAGTIPNQQTSSSATVTVVAPTVASLTVAPSTVALLVGQSATLTATARSVAGAIMPGASLTWVSLDPAVASVSNAGVVSAVAAGSTTVRVTSGSVTANVPVTVTAPPPVPVATVTVAPNTATLATGTTVTLTATTRDSAGGTLSGRTIAWSSGTPTVAQVSAAGVVTAVSVGTATVTAMSEGKSGTATITVTPPPVASVTVTPGTSTLFVGATQPLVATPRDGNGNVLTGETITWSSSAPTIASISVAGIATALAEGTTTITATVRGVSGTATVTARAARVAYALIDQPTAASHTPAAATQFNGL